MGRDQITDNRLFSWKLKTTKKIKILKKFRDKKNIKLWILKRPEKTTVDNIGSLKEGKQEEKV